MNWLQIAINTTKNNVEQVEDCLLATGAHTVTLTDAADQPILEPGVDETPIWNAVVITGLFTHEDNAITLLESLKQQLSDIDYTATTEILEDQNWTRAWMDHFHPMQFGERLWVCPLHLEPPEPEAINLRLDPGLAFGTGTHQTTSLCLRWLDQHIAGGESILDFGWGSGILAIATCLLGAAHADGVDIDPKALHDTHDNAVVKQVNEKIDAYLSEDYEKQHADTV